VGDLDKRKIPTLICGLLSGQYITKLALGWRHTVAVSDIGDVYAWGANMRGELGLGYTHTYTHTHTHDARTRTRTHDAHPHNAHETTAGARVVFPRLMLQGKRVVHVAAGGEHTVCLRDSPLHSALSLDLGCVVNSRLFSDLRFVLDTPSGSNPDQPPLDPQVDLPDFAHPVYAHQCVVRARCTAFHKHLMYGTRGLGSVSVRVRHCSRDAFLVFLRFLYTDRADDIPTRLVLEVCVDVCVCVCPSLSRTLTYTHMCVCVCVCIYAHSSLSSHHIHFCLSIPAFRWPNWRNATGNHV
jgi:Regulator of chromosome condensation (RCC1) repeat